MATQGRAECGGGFPLLGQSVRQRAAEGSRGQGVWRTFHIVVGNDQVDGQAHCRQLSIAGSKVGGQGGGAAAGQDGLMHLCVGRYSIVRRPMRDARVLLGRTYSKGNCARLLLPRQARAPLWRVAAVETGMGHHEGLAVQRWQGQEAVGERLSARVTQALACEPQQLCQEL